MLYWCFLPQAPFSQRSLLTFHSKSKNSICREYDQARQIPVIPFRTAAQFALVRAQYLYCSGFLVLLPLNLYSVSLQHLLGATSRVPGTHSCATVTSVSKTIYLTVQLLLSALTLFYTPGFTLRSYGTGTDR